MEHSGDCVTNCPESPMDISERSDLINRNIHKQNNYPIYLTTKDLSS